MTIDVSAPTAAATILERAVCLRLHCSELGNNRKVPLDALAKAMAKDGGAADTADLDEKQFHATMRLLDPEVLRPVARVQARAKAYLRGIGLPAADVFGEGTTLIPVDKAEEADARLAEFAAELSAESVKLAEAYADAVAAQAVKLGPLFDPALYKTEAEVRQAFTLEWRFVSFQAPDRLESVSSALARASQRRFEADLADAFDGVVAALRGEALEVMADLERRLTPDASGKQKVLRGTALRDVQQFIASLPSRNIVGDDALAESLARIRALADGLDVQSLRDSAALRDGLREAAAEAREALAGLVATGRRAISFEEIPVGA